MIQESDTSADRMVGEGALPASLGDYVLEGRIGAGSITESFSATRFGVEGFEKVVVVKRVHPHLAAIPTFATRLGELALQAAGLTHANVVQVLDLATGDSGTSFIVNELVRGTSLANLIEHAVSKRVPIPDEIAAYVVGEVAKALDYMHRRRKGALVHAGLSPANVLLSWEGEVKVSDARIHEALRSVRFAPHESRSLPYQSPESFVDGAPTAADDVFAIGAIAYELCTRKPAFLESEPDATKAHLLRGLGGDRLEAVENEPLRKIIASLLGPVGSRPTARALHEDLVGWSYSSSAFNRTPGRATHTTPDSRLLADFVSRLCRHGEIPVPSLSGAESLFPSLEEAPTEAKRESPDLGVSEIAGESTPAEIEAAPSRPRSAELRDAALLAVFHLNGAESLATARALLESRGALVVASDKLELRAVFGVRAPDARDVATTIDSALALLAVLPEVGLGVDIGRVVVDGAGEVISDLDLGPQFRNAAALASGTKGEVRVTRVAAHWVASEVAFEEAGAARRAIKMLPRGTSEARFVGRREEFVKLGESFDRVREGTAELVVLSGEVGSGKTRFALEIERRWLRIPLATRALWVNCPVDPTPLGAFSRFVTEATREIGGDPRPEQEARLSGELSAEDVSELALSLVGGLGAGLTLVVFDGAEELDGQSATAIAEVVTAAQERGARLLALVSGRRVPQSLLELARTHVELGPLGEDDVSALVASLAGASILPAAISDFVGRAAGGVPMFVEAILRELVEQGRITREGPRLTADLRDAGLPRTLRSALQGRFLRTSAAEQKILRAIAILGEGASIDHLARVVQEKIDDLKEILARFTPSFLVPDPLGRGPGTLRGAYRDVVLESVPEEDRAALHLQAARSIEEASEPTPEGLERIAGHYQAAGDNQSAARRFAAAAKLHQSPNHGIPRWDLAGRAAARSLSLSLLGETELEPLIANVSILAESASVLRVALGAEDDAFQVVQRVDKEKGEGPSSAGDRARIRIDFARIASAESAFEGARSALQAAAELAKNERLLLERVFASQVEVAVACGDILPGLEAAERTIEFGQINDPAVLANVAELFAQARDEVRTDLALERASDLAERASSAARALVEAKRGRAELWLGRTSQAQRTSVLAADLAEAVQGDYLLAHTRLTLGRAYLDGLRLERAYAAFMGASDAAHAGGYLWEESLARAFLIHLDGLRTGRDLEARKTLLELAKKSEARGFGADALAIRELIAGSFSANGDGESAARELETIAERARSLGHKALEKRALDRLASASRPR